MPTETFLNLNETKRERFLSEAFREFALNTYHEASISRIVHTLGIAKGSLYQYFGDKADLYFHLLEIASTSKLTYIEESSGALARSPDFFDVYRSIVLAGAEFDFGNPAQSLVIVNAMREPPTAELGDLAAEMTDRSAEFLSRFVSSAVDRGEIRADIDLDLIVSAVNSVTLALGPHMESVHGFSLRDQLKHPERPLPFTSVELATVVDGLITILHSGISPPSE